MHRPRHTTIIALLLLLILAACVGDVQPTAPPATPVPATRGATVPWIEYEAEAGSTNGELLAASRKFGEIATESSGRQAVRLGAAGQYVEITSTLAANSIVVRFVIPDAPAGGGITATLSLYVNDSFKQKLTLTSKYAWAYGGEEQTLNDPAAGGAHHFYDEARALLDEIPAGARVRLQKDAGDSAEYYVLDLIDLEHVGPPLAMPENFISIVDCGAIPDDALDDGVAIQSCVSRAQGQDKGLWIPPGNFLINRSPLSNRGIRVANVTVQGAGMWYSNIGGLVARFNCGGDNCRFADFSILGEVTERRDDVAENGFNGGAGKGSRLDRVWVEHTKVGWWVGDGPNNVTDGLVISNSRFRNLFADGVNFCNGTSNSVIEQSHFRNTGDDALASWAPSFDGGVNTNNVFRFNTVQLPWRANCFAIYGGKDNRIEDNVCSDVVTYPGILIAMQFAAWPFEGTTTIARNSLIRAGGPMFRQEHGALKIYAQQEPMSGIVVKDLLIESPTFAGLQIDGREGLTNSTFENVTISDAGGAGILITSAARGEAEFKSVSVTSAASGALHNLAGPRFTIMRGEGNSGW